MRTRSAGRHPSSVRRAVPRRRELSCLIAAVLASGAVVEQAAAREVPFAEPPAISTSADDTRSVFAADLDGDGDRDVLAAIGGKARVTWYENTAGDGSAWTSHILGSIFNPTSVFASDVDGDGDVDALAVSSGDSTIGDGTTVAWYENTAGDGSAWSEHAITTSTDGGRSVFAADVDGDGDMDALSASYSDNKIAWYENTAGDGLNWATHTITTAANGAYSVFAADVDGDGDLDALSTSIGDDKIAWYENTAGDGSVWSLHTIDASANSSKSVFATDVDGDGDLDVLAASSLFDKIAWYENTTGDGSAWSLHTITTSAEDAYSVFAADVDDDGDMDALSASQSDNKIAWYENDGTGGGWTLHTITTAAGTARSVFAADVDGDGDLDTLSASSYDDKIAWYRNDTIHRSAVLPDESVVSTDAYGAESVYAADVDGDGDLDALSASVFDNKVAWYENEDGAGGSWTIHTISATAEQAQSVFAADVDGDGDVDALSASQVDNKIAWYENEAGAGQLWTIHTISTSAIAPQSVFAADLDDDGDIDALSASSFDNIAWYENDGAGGGWALHTISTTADGARSVFAADVDGDGDLDALSASGDDNKIAWYENDGAGGGWALHTISTSAIYAQSVFAADVDGDGDLDALSASSLYSEIAWHENTSGDGSTWMIHTISTAASGPQSVFATDVDRDGDLDVLSASLFDDKIAWYENRGGQFALPTLNTAQKIVNNASTHDLLDIEAVHRGRAGDSDAELVTLELKLTDGSGSDLTSTQANNLIEELRIYLDDGSGEFDGAPTDAVVHTISSFTLTGGVETITFDDGNANAQLPFASPKIYFAVADLTADADGQTPSAFQLTHLTESSSTGEDAAHDIPLTLEFWPDTGTGVVDTTLSTASCEAPFELLLSDRTVTTAVACQAGTFIRAGTNFIVGSSGDLSLSAGETIRFTSGFHVDTGTLTVNIDPTLKP